MTPSTSPRRSARLTIAILALAAAVAPPGAVAGPLPGDPTGLLPAACDDGLDNDGDGLVDARLAAGDPGCDGPTDLSEHAAHLVCDDGVDNDGDLRVDYAIVATIGDAGCSDPLDASE